MFSMEEFGNLIKSIDEWNEFNNLVYRASHGDIDFGNGPSGKVADNLVAVIAKVMTAANPEKEHNVMEILYSWLYEHNCGRYYVEISAIPDEIETTDKFYLWLVNYIN